MNTAEKQKVALSSIHDFAAKLRQPDTLPRVREYVKWLASGENRNPEAMPDFAPVSINLDLTTACNYACDHCVDKEILNLNIRYDHQRLLDSLQLMAEKGLKSVIVIGGGEPTTYPKFEETIRFMKELKLQVSIVSNGAGNKRIHQGGQFQF
jgi:sulfatase maturation enzyme AslB (radical SAM superfamily)